MSVFAQLLHGFASALLPLHLLLAAAGVTLGTLVGVLPGIGPALTVALLLPLTAKLPPTGAFIMFAGVYYGGMYGGSTTSILLNTPGESASVATALEGFQMAKRGRGGPALATAAIGSFVAGTLSTLALTFLAPIAARLALSLQPADYVALVSLAFVSVAALAGRSLSRAALSLFLGLLLGMVGIDTLSGKPRLTLGIQSLYDGIDVVVVAVGLFAVGETLHSASRRADADTLLPLEGSVRMTREDWRRSAGAWLRGSVLGFIFGVLPAGGAEVPTFLSYALEKKLSRHPAEFGKGAIEGVAGPEAANNAAASGVLVPLLTLGLPTSSTAAVLLAAFQMYDLRPGPLLFEKAPDLVWALIASLYLGNVMLLLLNLPLARVWVKLLAIPRPLLDAGILLFATLGVYSLAGDLTDVLLMYAVGALGFVMRRYDVPLSPMVLGVILMPLFEVHLRRALALAEDRVSVLLWRPLPVSVLLVGFGLIALQFRKKRPPARNPAT